jgi:magnesium transporter
MERLPSFSDSPHEGYPNHDLNHLVALLEKSFEEANASPQSPEHLSEIVELLDALHPSDGARLIQYLRGHHRLKLMELLRTRLNPEILSFLDETVRGEVLHFLETEELAEALSRLESDDAFLILEELEETRRKDVLEALSSKNRAIFEEILTYPEDSAGRLMQRELVAVPSYWTVQQTRQFILENKNLPDIFYDVFVVDPKHHPLGVVPLSKLLTTALETSLTDVMHTDLHRIMVNLDQEEVAQVFRQYSLVSAPVVDASGRLLGTITVDDVVHVIDEEAEEDIMHLAGVSESDFYAPILTTSFLRIRWLLVTLINTLIASAVISQFQATLEKKIAVAVLMPIVAAMGGNSGMQVVTVTVRALATRELDTANMLRAIWKEISVALLNGLFFACLLGVLVAVWFHEIQLGVVLGGAMAFNMLWAGIAGTSLPILVHRLGMDPALSAGPLLTTTTDVFGFSIFLTLATFFL